MNRMTSIVGIVCVLIVFGFSAAAAEERIAEQAYQVFQAHCMTCHGEQGTFKETLRVERASLIESGTVIPGNPLGSEFYRRLTENTVVKPQMPLGTPPLSAAAIDTVERWILAGAPDWDVSRDVNFIPHEAMLKQLSAHLLTLSAFDRPFARYFTMTHLYNAGESPETLHLYRTALSKLVNSLSWGSEVINPQPIDELEILFYIDLRQYEWDIRGDAWGQIEAVYPYTIEYDVEEDPVTFLYLSSLREGTDSAVPFVHVDWFLATAALPPLYHDILDLPETARQLETALDVNVKRNLQNAPGLRVWRAGFNDSGVSSHNRVVERHTSRYGAYWKSYDFAGSSEQRNIYRNPLSFQPDGGEVIFHLPNGLQAYLIVDADGQRIDVAPTGIVSNPQASDPAVYNGLSCIGCHTEGMKPFTDTVRAAILSEKNPAYDKAQALRLYVEKTQIEPWVEKDAQQFRNALEATGTLFGGLVEPVSFAHEAFIGPVSAADAAAAVGLETETFLTEIREKSSLQSLGLLALAADGGNVKRDVWTTNFQQVVTALKTEDVVPAPRTPTRVPSDTVAIPDPNLRAVIAAILGKAEREAITAEDMLRLTRIEADDAGIHNLTGLEAATRLERIELRRNSISDLSPLRNLTRLNNIKLRGNKITNVAPLAGLVNVDWLGLEENQITDFSPLKGLIKLKGIGLAGNPVSDISALSSLRSLEGINADDTAISDFSPLANLPRLRWLEYEGDQSVSKLPSLKGLKRLRTLKIAHCRISDISQLAGLTQLQALRLYDNFIQDVSPLAALKALEDLNLGENLISDLSPLAKLTKLKKLYLGDNRISDVSPLAGLTQLEELHLQYNAISDFSPIEGLSVQINIKAHGNPGTFVKGGPKIVGPWLWVLLPGATYESFRSTDLLAKASGGKVKELGIAANGAIEGQAVGDSVWTPHSISSTGGNNINEMLNALGMSKDTDSDNVVYGSISLESPREQRTKMFVGSDDNHKVWLNGKLVNEKLDRDWATDYQQSFPVTLKQGENVLLVAVHDRGGDWCGHFGFSPDAEYTVLLPVPNFSFSTDAPPLDVGNTFEVVLKATNLTDLAGWQGDLVFDPAVLKVNSAFYENFLKQGGGSTHIFTGEIDNARGRINGLGVARISEGGVSGEGTLLSVSFTAKAAGETRISMSNFKAGSSAGETISVPPIEIFIILGGDAPAAPAWDVNEDGITDAVDLQLVVASLGETAPVNPRTDVNGDGVVDAKDLTIVSEHLGEGTAPAAPPSIAHRLGLRPETVEHALDVLRAAENGTLTFRRGIANLQRLLATFIPEETALLANYPNPFNPETWIPYQLAEAADVAVHIYTVEGRLVRILDVGHQPAGLYAYRSRAAYWDGRNMSGEPVASGVYFYTLSAGDFTATRKMLIKK